MYTFICFPGNNSGLICRALENRGWKNIAPLEFEPAGLDGKEPHEVESALRKAKKGHRKVVLGALLEQEFNFCWRPTLSFRTNNFRMETLHTLPIGAYGMKENPAERQLVNHFPTIKPLTTKTGLFRSMSKFYKANGIDVFTVCPLTYICVNKFSEKTADLGWTSFLLTYRAITRKQFSHVAPFPAKHCQENLWIVKPAHMNQGKGIVVMKSLSKIRAHLAAQETNASWIIQKYIEKPLLISGRKFDFRIWVLVSESFDVYLYREGYLRTSSELFTLDCDGEAASMTHLTNYCMQVKSKNLGKFEEGNTLSFDQFQAYCDEHLPEKKIDVRKDIFSRIREIAIDTLLSCKKVLREGNRGRHCFELFGYDFMVDEDLRVFLIEINTNPYLGVQNPWHAGLLEKMASDMMERVVDPLFPIASKPSSSENWFDLIYSDDVDALKEIPGHIRDSSDPLGVSIRRRSVSWHYPHSPPPSPPPDAIPKSPIHIPKKKKKRPRALSARKAPQLPEKKPILPREHASPKLVTVELRPDDRTPSVSVSLVSEEEKNSRKLGGKDLLSMSPQTLVNYLSRAVQRQTSTASPSTPDPIKFAHFQRQISKLLNAIQSMVAADPSCILALCKGGLLPLLWRLDTNEEVEPLVSQILLLLSNAYRYDAQLRRKTPLPSIVELVEGVYKCCSPESILKARLGFGLSALLHLAQRTKALERERVIVMENGLPLVAAYALSALSDSTLEAFLAKEIVGCFTLKELKRCSRGETPLNPSLASCWTVIAVPAQKRLAAIIVERAERYRAAQESKKKMEEQAVVEEQEQEQRRLRSEAAVQEFEKLVLKRKKEEAQRFKEQMEQREERMNMEREQRLRRQMAAAKRQKDLRMEVVMQRRREEEERRREEEQDRLAQHERLKMCEMATREWERRKKAEKKEKKAALAARREREKHEQDALLESRRLRIAQRTSFRRFRPSKSSSGPNATVFPAALSIIGAQ